MADRQHPPRGIDLALVQPLPAAPPASVTATIPAPAAVVPAQLAVTASVPLPTCVATAAAQAATAASCPAAGGVSSAPHAASSTAAPIPTIRISASTCHAPRYTTRPAEAPAEPSAGPRARATPIAAVARFAEARRRAEAHGPARRRAGRPGYCGWKLETAPSGDATQV